MSERRAWRLAPSAFLPKDPSGYGRRHPSSAYEPPLALPKRSIAFPATRSATPRTSMGIALRRYAAEAPQHPARRFAVDQRSDPVAVLPPTRHPWRYRKSDRIRSGSRPQSQSGSRTAGRCRSRPRRGLPIREGYLRRSRLRPPGEVSPAASERREGLFDVEVDAEEQERPKDDGQQR
jgi:hypothetical protein